LNKFKQGLKMSAINDYSYSIPRSKNSNNRPLSETPLQRFQDYNPEYIKHQMTFVKYANLVSESCLTKTAIATIGGGLLGLASGVFFTIMESGAPSTYPVPELKNPSKYKAVNVLRETGLQMRDRSKFYSKSFALVGAIYSSFECVVEKYRGKHDRLNSLYAGCLSGGTLAHSTGPKGILLGCAGFAAFSVIIDSIMDH
jgi:import inner membrane translocase subunit TIM22